MKEKLESSEKSQVSSTGIGGTSITDLGIHMQMVVLQLYQSETGIQMKLNVV